MMRLILGVSAVALVWAGTVLAAPDQAPVARSETRAEAQARAATLFDKLDLNHDGKLDQADRGVRTNQMFDRLDTNHDGVISRDEFAAAPRRDHGPDHQGADHSGDDGRHPGGHMGHWGDDHHAMKGLVWLIIHRADPGHSGTVTRDAFIGAALALFDQADTNHDGILTADEHHAAAQAMRGQDAGRWHHHGDGGGDMPPKSPSGN